MHRHEKLLTRIAMIAMHNIILNFTCSLWQFSVQGPRPLSWAARPSRVPPRWSPSWSCSGGDSAPPGWSWCPSGCDRPRAGLRTRDFLLSIRDFWLLAPTEAQNCQSLCVYIGSNLINLRIFLRPNFNTSTVHCNALSVRH